MNKIFKNSVSNQDMSNVKTMIMNRLSYKYVDANLMNQYEFCLKPWVRYQFWRSSLRSQ